MTHDSCEPHTQATPSYNIKLEENLRDLNNKVALLMDKFTTSERAQQSALQAPRQEMNRLTELMHQHVNMAPTVRQTAQPTWKFGPDGCWYCEKPGHFAMNCPHREEHIRIKISGSKMFFALTGQPVPRGSNGKSAKSIVEEASNKSWDQDLFSWELIPE